MLFFSSQSAHDCKNGWALPALRAARLGVFRKGWASPSRHGNRPAEAVRDGLQCGISRSNPGRRPDIRQSVRTVFWFAVTPRGLFNSRGTSDHVEILRRSFPLTKAAALRRDQCGGDMFGREAICRCVMSFENTQRSGGVGNDPASETHADALLHGFQRWRDGITERSLVAGLSCRRSTYRSFPDAASASHQLRRIALQRLSASLSEA